MNLIIDLTPFEEAQLSQVAKQTGLAPEELVKKLVQAHLPASSTPDADDIDERLRKWQKQDDTNLAPDVSTKTLFAQWAKEDSQMTASEREAENRLWEDLEKGLTEHNGMLRLRRLG